VPKNPPAAVKPQIAAVTAISLVVSIVFLLYYDYYGYIHRSFRTVWNCQPQCSWRIRYWRGGIFRIPAISCGMFFVTILAPCNNEPHVLEPFFTSR